MASRREKATDPGRTLYGYSSFRQTACLYFCFLFVLLYCVSYLLFLEAGFLTGGGEGGGGGPVLQF